MKRVMKRVMLGAGRCAGAVLLIASCLFTACGGGGVRTTPVSVANGGVLPVASAPPVSASASPAAVNPGSLPATVVTGKVTLPAGSTIALNTLEAVNGLTRAAVSATGSFSMLTFSDGPQLTIIETAGSTPVLMGFLSAATATIDVTATAEATLYFALGAASLPSALRDQVFAQLPSAPGISTLSTAIATALASNPNAFAVANSSVAAALGTVVTGLTGSGASSSSGAARLRGLLTQRGAAATSTATRSPLGVLINPGQAMSGLTPLIDFPNGFHFENTLRRSADLYINQLSYVDQSGNTVADAANLTPTPQSIPATTGLGGGTTSTFANIVTGNYAYAPIDTATTPLTNVSGARYTNFTLTAVGPGAVSGALSQLTADQVTDQQKVSVSFLVTAFIIPTALTFILPSKDIDAAAGEGSAGAIQDFVNALVAVPNLAQTAASGDMGSAFVMAINSLLQANSTTNLYLQALLDSIVTNIGFSEEKSALALAEEYTNALGVTDKTLQAIDTGAIGAALLQSDKADIWNVSVTDATVTLTPSTAAIYNNQMGLFTANVPSAGGSASAFAYTYTNTAQYGHISDGLPGHTDNFQSSLATVKYTANATGTGSDTIGVSVALIDGQSRIPVGSQSATVNVGPSPAPTPAPLTISPAGCTNFGEGGGTQTYTVSTTLIAPAGHTLWFGWTLGSGTPTSGSTFTDPGSTYSSTYGYIGPSATATVTTQPDPSGYFSNLSLSVQPYFINTTTGKPDASTDTEPVVAYFSYGEGSFCGSVPSSRARSNDNRTSL